MLIGKLMVDATEYRSEMDKMRQRINKYRQNIRGNWHLGSKLRQMYCKNCGKEFADADNFNWSCRFHRGEWGGVIWWCCGKGHKEAKGKDVVYVCH